MKSKTAKQYGPQTSFIFKALTVKSFYFRFFCDFEISERRKSEVAVA